jgi:hypothetical protein
MVTFLDQHRDTYGVEPICAVLPIAPSTYFRRRAQQQDAAQRLSFITAARYRIQTWRSRSPAPV